MRERPGLKILTFVFATILGAAQVGATCVDGVTPDCSDAAVCAPAIDGGSEVVEGGEDDADGGDGGAIAHDADADADGG
jgi:hypothetical protein